MTEYVGPDQVLTPLSFKALNDAVVAASSVLGRMFSETRFAGVQGGGMAALTAYREAVEAAIRAPLEAEVERMKGEVRDALGVPDTTETRSWPHLVNAIMVERVISRDNEAAGVALRAIANGFPHDSKHPAAILARAALAGVPKEACE